MKQSLKKKNAFLSKEEFPQLPVLLPNKQPTRQNGLVRLHEVSSKLEQTHPKEVATVVESLNKHTQTKTRENCKKVKREKLLLLKGKREEKKDQRIFIEICEERDNKEEEEDGIVRRE